MPSCENKILNIVTEMHGDIKQIQEKLFIGNGAPPLTMMVDRNTMFRRVISWVTGSVFIVVVLGVVARLLFVRLTGSQ